MKSAPSAAYRKIALVGKYQSPEIGGALRELSAHLVGRGCEVLVEQTTAAATGTPDFPALGYGDIGRSADLAIVIGGDGTMLHTARQLAQYSVPMVGINQGRLGFMTDLSRRDMIERVDELLAGRFFEERRFLLEARVSDGSGAVFETLALNDVVINKGDLGRMIECEVRIDGEFVYMLRSDGLIVSTPTGSTAYALSANGPILHPGVPGIAVVPLCPHALSNRPITISDQSVIEVRLVHPHDGRVHFDGQERRDVRTGDVIRLGRSRHEVRLLHPPGYSYFAMLREKLRWSEAPRNP